MKKVVALVKQGYQDVDVAVKLGLSPKSRAVPLRVRQQLHIEGTANQLKTSNKERAKARAEAQAEHKWQPKLL